MPRMLLMALVSLAATPACATPTTLTCVFRFPDYPIEIELDEATNRVTVALPYAGYRKRSRASFIATQVLFKDDVYPYQLSLTDLRIIRGVPGSRRAMTGRCRLRNIQNRATQGSGRKLEKSD